MFDEGGELFVERRPDSPHARLGPEAELAGRVHQVRVHAVRVLPNDLAFRAVAEEVHASVKWELHVVHGCHLSA